MPANECKAIKLCHLAYNKTLYGLFSKLITKFTNKLQGLNTNLLQ